jgi:hypothetical protein
MGTPLLGAKVQRSSGYEDPEAMDQDWTNACCCGRIRVLLKGGEGRLPGWVSDQHEDGTKRLRLNWPLCSLSAY